MLSDELLNHKKQIGMIHIKEKKLKAAIQIALGENDIYTEDLENTLVHHIKALSIAFVSNNEERVTVCDIAMCEKSAGASIFYDPCKDCADNPQTDC